MLGMWQLDRHEKRQEFNNRVESQQILPPLVLDNTAPTNFLEEMEYREVTVRGVYNFNDQIALINQVWENSPGVNLVTPLIIENMDSVILVNRGWIPLEDSHPENWAGYDEPGVVEIHGIIRKSTTNPEIGNKSDLIPAQGAPVLKEWNLLNVEKINDQVDGELLPVYIHKSALEISPNLPVPTTMEIELTDGPHLGYAGQWFLFAVILGVGYPIFLYRSRTKLAENPSKISTKSEIVRLD
jgi:surfeit locus 1 family protein